jgi:uracil-DNA glycosylase
MIMRMKLIHEIRNCTLCADVLPLEPRPIFQLSASAKILIISQAPGIKAHESNKPWNDASGIRLREWLKINEQDFYDAKKTALIPMGFCYPGKSPSGDLPPRPECSARWMDTILCALKNVRIKIFVGSYSANHFIGNGILTDKIKEYAFNEEALIVLPHPSPRNNIWLSKNTWFEKESLPLIREKLKSFTI